MFTRCCGGCRVYRSEQSSRAVDPRRRRRANISHSYHHGYVAIYVFDSDVIRTLLTVLIDLFDKLHNILILALIWSHLKLNQCYRNYLVQIYCHSSGVVHLTSSGLSSHAQRLCVSRLFQERLAALTSARSTRTRSSSTGLSCVTMVTSLTCWRMSAGQWRQRIVSQRHSCRILHV